MMILRQQFGDPDESCLNPREVSFDSVGVNTWLLDKLE